MKRLPLAVDMDGTLLEVDVLAAGMRKLWRDRPAALLAAFFALLLGGRPPFKRAVAAAAGLDVADLPLRSPLLNWLRAERAAGRTIWLATAADRATAERVAAHVGLFDGVLASDGAVNLKADAKRRALEARFPGGYVYAGDSAADLSVWRGAKAMVLVGASARLAQRANRLGVTLERSFPA